VTLTCPVSIRLILDAEQSELLGDVVDGQLCLITQPAQLAGQPAGRTVGL